MLHSYSFYSREDRDASVVQVFEGCGHDQVLEVGRWDKTIGHDGSDIVEDLYLFWAVDDSKHVAMNLTRQETIRLRTHLGELLGLEGERVQDPDPEVEAWKPQFAVGDFVAYTPADTVHIAKIVEVDEVDETNPYLIAFDDEGNDVSWHGEDDLTKVEGRFEWSPGRFRAVPDPLPARADGEFFVGDRVRIESDQDTNNGRTGVLKEDDGSGVYNWLVALDGSDTTTSWCGDHELVLLGVRT